MNNASNPSYSVFSSKINVPKVFLDNKPFVFPAHNSQPQSTKNAHNPSTSTTQSHRLAQFVLLAILLLAKPNNYSKKCIQIKEFFSS